MAAEIIKQQQKLGQPQKPSFFDDEEKSIDAQIAQEQAAANPPIQVENPVGIVQQPTASQQVQVQQRPKTASERLQEFYASVRPQKPEYDPNRIEEINRLKKNNSIGEGLKVLGDVFALAKGANVNRREPNVKNDRLQEAAWQYMDRYNQMMNDWNYKDYLAKMKGAETSAADEWRDKTMKQQQANADRNYNFNYRKYYDDKKRQAELDQKGDDYRDKALQMRVDELEWRKNAPYVDFNLWKKKWDLQNEAELKKAIIGAGDKSKSDYLYDDKGQQIYQIRTSGERDKLLSIILQDEQANKELDALKSTFGENMTTNIQNYLVQKYWNRSPEAMAFISAAQGTVKPEPISVDPVQQNQPNQQNKTVEPTVQQSTPIQQAQPPKQVQQNIPSQVQTQGIIDDQTIKNTISQEVAAKKISDTINVLRSVGYSDDDIYNDLIKSGYSSQLAAQALGINIPQQPIAEDVKNKWSGSKRVQ